MIFTMKEIDIGQATALTSPDPLVLVCTEKLQGIWKFQILYELCIKDPIRFGELRKNIAGITNTMLTSSLRELERDGLVSRIQYNEIPPHVEYSLI